MKTLLYTLYTFSALSLSVVLFGCQKPKEENYIPRVLTTNEDFNAPSPEPGILTISKFNDQQANKDTDSKEWFGVTYKNAAVRIQTDPANQKSGTDKFAFAQFVNTQKTCLLVQLADNSGLVAPFYLVALKNNKLEVVSLYRPSAGERDLEFTKGKDRIGNAGFLINNDFIVTNVNAKVYLIKRPEPKERIQGSFIISSPDKKTLVFLVASRLYQLHYPTGYTFSEPLDVKLSPNTANLYAWVQKNYRWERDKRGIAFLKPIDNGNEIVDMSRSRS